MKTSSLDSIAILLLRVCVGGMMAFGHGWGKLMQFTEMRDTFPDPLGVGSQLSLALAIFGEFVAPLAVILGFKTRLAALPTLFTMLVAGFVIHSADPFAKKEMALLYAACFATITLLGSGSFSLDHLFSKGRSK